MSDRHVLKYHDIELPKDHGEILDIIRWHYKNHYGVETHDISVRVEKDHYRVEFDQKVGHRPKEPGHYNHTKNSIEASKRWGAPIAKSLQDEDQEDR